MPRPPVPLPVQSRCCHHSLSPPCPLIDFGFVSSIALVSVLTLSFLHGNLIYQVLYLGPGESERVRKGEGAAVNRKAEAKYPEYPAPLHEVPDDGHPEG